MTLLSQQSRVLCCRVNERNDECPMMLYRHMEVDAALFRTAPPPLIPGVVHRVSVVLGRPRFYLKNGIFCSGSETSMSGSGSPIESWVYVAIILHVHCVACPLRYCTM